MTYLNVLMYTILTAFVVTMVVAAGVLVYETWSFGRG